MSQGLAKGYNPEFLTIVFNGALLDGFGPDSKVEITFPDEFSKVVGSDGEVAVSRSNDQTCQLKITLLQTSLSNDILSTFHNLHRNNAPGGVGPILVRDLKGTFSLSGPQAWTMKFADSTFGKEIQTREWTIDCGGVEVNIGSAFPEA